jgi:oligopeptide/dipeptide ABC transporter ATP-binding protein
VNSAPLVEIRQVVKEFVATGSWLEWPQKRRQRVHAVNDVSLEIFPHEILGLVGESGCGKTTLGYMIVGLIRPTSGQIKFEGHDIAQASRAELRVLRQKIQMIFQDPFSSIDPRQSVEEAVREPLDIHRIGSSKQRKRRVLELLDLVALPNRYLHSYPHELSGGLRQRVGIAAALALNPKLIIADEPTSALDASVQAGIVNLLVDLQQQTGVACLLISHNLDIIRHVSHRVAVMYFGEIVEIGPCDLVYNDPQHPYSRALLASVLPVDPSRRSIEAGVLGEVPSPIDPPGGCAFHPRCPLVEERCRLDPPALVAYEAARLARCHVTSDLFHRTPDTDRGRPAVIPPRS